MQTIWRPQKVARRSLCGGIVLLVFVSALLRREEMVSWDETIDVPVKRFILEKLAPTNASEHFLPSAVVFLDERKKEGPTGMGTIITDSAGTIKGIITSEHLFPKDIKRGRAFYKPLNPMVEEWLPIERVENSLSFGTNHLDVVLCIPGEGRDIRGFSRYRGKRHAHLRAWKYTNAPPLRSVLSGEETRVIGLAVERNESAPWTILLYDGQGNESGLGCFNDAREIYVISSVIEVTPEWQRAFSIPPAFRHVSLAHTVRIKL